MSPARLRLLRVVSLALATAIAIPASLVVRSAFFPPRLDVPSIQREPQYQNPTLLERAYQLPVAQQYRAHLLFQENGSLYGPASVANVLRSLGTTGATSTSVLAGRGECWTGVCWGGLTLDALADLTREVTGRKVTLLRELSLSEFRAELPHVNDLARRYIVSFQRAPLFAEGGGHHSPIAAYLAAEDLVLVLDVNENYRPWLVGTERLFRAVDTTDNGKKRGLLRIE